MSDNQPAAVRGRNPTAKPLKPSASSDASTSVHPTTNNSAGDSSPVSRTPSKSSDSGRIKVTKLSSTTVTLPTTWAQKIPTSEPSIEEQPQTRTSDQLYPWHSMTSTLDACFKNVEAAATSDLGTHTQELDATEAKIADQRERSEAERAIATLHELESQAFANEAPAIMQLFHSHGISCDRIETEALKLSAHNEPSESNPNKDEPLKLCNDMLESLEALQKEARNLESLIIKLTNTPNVDDETNVVHSQAAGVFAACIPILHARIANLSLAQELVDSVLENASLSLRMESMGIV